LNSFVYALRLSMITSPSVYHGLNFLSIFSGDVHYLKKN